MATNLSVDPMMRQMAGLCAEHGMPLNQVENFIKAGYIVLEQNMDFHAASREADLEDGPDEIALGGTRGSAKSHTVMAQVGLDDCQRFPGLKFLFLRRLMKSAAESLDDLTRKVFTYVPHTITAAGVEFGNGSRIVIGGYKDLSDIDKYLGIEYDGIAIEEATQLTKDKRDHIYGSRRTSKPGWRPRSYLTTNADGIGLGYFKADYVTPARQHKETTTRFFDVHFNNNPFIDRGYVRWLMGLKGPLAKAWRDADWDAFAGMMFPAWSYERNVIEGKDQFDIPAHWLKWTATDWGRASPWCNGWLTKNPDSKRIYVYREAYEVEMTDRQQAERILDMTPPEEKITLHYGDPSMWITKTHENQVFSSADEYKKNGVALTKGNNNRIMGVRMVNNALADLPDGKPGLMVFDTCPHLIEQMGSLSRDELQPEDVDTEQEDHAFDMLKYGLTNERRLIPASTDKSKDQNPLNKYKEAL